MHLKGGSILMRTTVLEVTVGDCCCVAEDARLQEEQVEQERQDRGRKEQEEMNRLEAKASDTTDDKLKRLLIDSVPRYSMPNLVFCECQFMKYKIK